MSEKCPCLDKVKIKHKKKGGDEKVVGRVRVKVLSALRTK